MYVPTHYTRTSVCPVTVTMDTWMSHPQLLHSDPKHTHVWSIESTSHRKDLEMEFNDKTGQTALTRHRAWPDQYTDQQTAERWLVPFIFLSLQFYTFVPPQTTMILPFHTFDSSPKQPITSLAQSQHAFLEVCRAKTQVSDGGTGVSAPLCVWRQGSYHIS